MKNNIGLRRKIIVFSLIILVQLVLLYAYHVNEDKIRPYISGDYYIRLSTLNFNYLKYSIEYENYTKSLKAQENYSIIDPNETVYAKSVPVLVYHGILPEWTIDVKGDIIMDGFNLPVKNFKDQMFTLKKAGWQTVSMSDFEAFMRGEKQLPDKSFLLTFDDGRKDSYYRADPVLKAVDYTAVMFVITGESLNPEKQNYKFHLNIDELRSMVKSGRWELEVHTAFGHGAPVISAGGMRGHFYSDKLWLPEQNRIETEEEFTKRVYNDIKLAKESLMNTFGINVTTFAYPFGDYGKDTKNFPGSQKIVFSTIDSLFNFGFYQTWVGQGYTYNYPNQKETALIKRLEPGIDWTGEKLLSYLEFGRAKDMPYDTNSETGFNGFVDNEGKLTDTNGALTLSTDENKMSAFTFLDGTYLWENYIYKMKVQKYSAQTLSLMSRVATSGDYVSCTYSKAYVQIIKSVNNQKKKITEGRISSLLSYGNFEVGMKVKGNNVSCMLNGKGILNAEINSNELKNGGIGFEIWSPFSNASITTDGITVSN